MGVLGGIIGGGIGDLLGGVVGKAIGQEDLVKELGSSGGAMVGGTLIPFENGGYVVNTTPALLHAGEFVLPANARPTLEQKKIVENNKKKTLSKYDFV